MLYHESHKRHLASHILQASEDCAKYRQHHTNLSSKIHHELCTHSDAAVDVVSTHHTVHSSSQGADSTASRLEEVRPLCQASQVQTSQNPALHSIPTVTVASSSNGSSSVRTIECNFCQHGSTGQTIIRCRYCRYDCCEACFYQSTQSLCRKCKIPILLTKSQVDQLHPQVQTKYFDDIKSLNLRFLDQYGAMASRAILHPTWVATLKMAYASSTDLLALMYPQIYNQLQIMKYYSNEISTTKLYSIKCQLVYELNKHPDIFFLQLIDADTVIIDGEIMVEL